MLALGSTGGANDAGGGAAAGAPDIAGEPSTTGAGACVPLVPKGLVPPIAWNAPAVTPAIKPLFTISAKLPPPSAVTPAEARPAVIGRLNPKGPRAMVSPMVAIILPTGDEIMSFATLTTLFTAPLIALPILRKIPPSEKNSGNPVAGLVVPDPPMVFNMAASSGLMCASMVSPLRPCDCNMCAISTRPPCFMAKGGCIDSCPCGKEPIPCCSSVGAACPFISCKTS